MYKKKRIAAVILAGGSGSRMGTAENKVYLPLDGKPVILYAAETFAAHPYVDELVFVTREEEQAETELLLQAEMLQKPWRIITGGASRRDSVYNALTTIHSDIVLVHDGARPLVQETDITMCVVYLEEYDGTILARPISKDTPIVRVSRKQRPPERLTQILYAAQTPQCFHTKTLRLCHERHRNNPAITDDSSLLELEGYKVGPVTTNPYNIKLTTPMDLPLAEAYLRTLMNI